MFTNKLILPFLLFIFAVNGTAHGAPQEPTSSERNINSFFPLFVDPSINMSYFLDELAIVDYQEKAIKKLKTKFLKRWLALREETLRSGENDVKWKTFQNDFFAELNEVVIPSQIDAMQQLLEQRSTLQKLNCESFEVLRLGNIKLGMSDAEFKKFAKASKLISAEFTRNRAKLSQTAWNKISRHIDDKESLIKDFRDFSSILKYEAQVPQAIGLIDFSELSNWRESDFDKFEKEFMVKTVFGLIEDEQLQAELGVLEYQVQEMASIRDAGLSEINEPFPSLENRQKYRELLANGDVPALKQMHKKYLDRQHEGKSRIVDEIVGAVFTKPQADLLSKISKFKRSIHESAYGDDFGAAIAWARSSEIPSLDVGKFVEAVEGARKEFYAGLKKSRKEACQKTIKLLPPAAKDKFEEQFGRFYDFQSEKISNWDSFRNNPWGQ